MSELTRSVGEIRIAIAGEARALEALQGPAARRSRSTSTPAAASSPSPTRSDKCEAEEVIGAVLQALLAQGVRISGVSKGRGLEERVMELT